MGLHQSHPGVLPAAAHLALASALTMPGLLFLQVVVILGICALVGRVLARLEQPPVVGQLIAGVMLGPSLFGWLLPAWQSALFPSPSLPVLNGFATVGVALYMFGVGYEIDFAFVRRNARSGAAVGVTGILVPLLFGALLGSRLVHDSRLFPQHAPAWTSVTFFAAAISVTAFPVMAAILSERGLLRTPVGSLSLVCGCFSDLNAWTMVALVVAGLAGNVTLAALTVAGVAAYMAVLLLVVRPALGWLLRRPGAEVAGGGAEVVVLALILAGSWWTESIGIHPAFGAFVLGTVVPRSPIVARAQERLRPFVVLFLLPLYFTYSGLNTRIGLLSAPGLLLLTALVVLVAFASKGIACSLAARLTGRPAREAVAIGALMNARGLVELVILSIGLQHGLITPTLFALMVVMTVATTLATSPILRLVCGPLPLGTSESSGASPPPRVASPANLPP